MCLCIPYPSEKVEGRKIKYKERKKERKKKKIKEYDDAQNRKVYVSWCVRVSEGFIYIT